LNTEETASPLEAVIPGHRETMSPESITTIVSMDSGPAPSGASRNDEGAWRAPWAREHGLLGTSLLN
jgi:hypothetical protein